MAGYFVLTGLFAGMTFLIACAFGFPGKWALLLALGVAVAWPALAVFSVPACLFNLGYWLWTGGLQKWWHGA